MTDLSSVSNGDEHHSGQNSKPDNAKIGGSGICHGKVAEGDPAEEQPHQLGRHAKARSRSRTRSPCSPSRRSSPSLSPRRADQPMTLLDPQAPSPAPPIGLGIQWWATPLWHAVEHKRQRLPATPRHTFAIQAVGCGMLTEAWGLKVFQPRISTLPRLTLILCATTTLKYKQPSPMMFHQMN